MGRRPGTGAVRVRQTETRTRDAVIGRLRDDLRKSPRFDLRPIPRGTMTDRDWHQARALHHELVRRLWTIEWLLESQLNRRLAELENALQAVLIVGAAQVLFVEHIPDHAAVDESVQWAKSHVRQGAGNLVNAVLRKMIALRGPILDDADWTREPVVPLSDGRYVSLNADVLPEDLTERLAIMTSHPTQTIRRWVGDGSLESAQRLAWHSFVHAPTILMHRGSDDATLPEGCTAHREKGFAVYGGASEDLGALLEREPDWRVQDPGSAVAIRAARPHVGQPELIVDLCAGSGTKTSQLLDTFKEAQIVACDPDQRRFAMLRVRFNNEPRVRLVRADEMIELSGTADLVLIDVPCSNSGALARRIEAKYRLDEPHFESLVKLQRQIMIDALRLRRPGSPILYSTCSIEPMENAQQSAWMERYNGVQTLASAGHDPNGQPGDDRETYHDGGYFAVWR